MSSRFRAARNPGHSLLSASQSRQGQDQPPGVQLAPARLLLRLHELLSAHGCLPTKRTHRRAPIPLIQAPGRIRTCHLRSRNPAGQSVRIQPFRGSPANARFLRKRFPAQSSGFRWLGLPPGCHFGPARRRARAAVASTAPPSAPTARPSAGAVARRPPARPCSPSRSALWVGRPALKTHGAGARPLESKGGHGPERRSGRVPSHFRRMPLPSTSTGRALIGVRTALGISTLLAPRLAGKAFFLNPDDNPQLPAIARMWGIRNLSLAAGMYAATGANRARWWRLQVAVDALDFLAISAEWRRGAVPGPAAGLMASTALAAATLGALSVSSESPQPG